MGISDTLFLIAIAVAVLLIAGPRLANILLPKTNALGIPGKLIWTDHGRRTKPFFYRRFGVFGKPDLMFKTGGDVLAVEYKSRHGHIYDSDIAQALCAALAARGEGYRVTRALIKTSTTERYIDLPKADQDLYRSIKKYIDMASDAKEGRTMMAKPNPRKCRACAYRSGCRHAAV